MDIPRSAESVEALPRDWAPGPIPPREEIVRIIRDILPTADVSDPSWVRVDGPDFSVEVSLGDQVPLTTFACHIRGGDAAIGFVAELLDALQLRAFDPGSDTGIFNPATAADSLRRWRDYRNQIITDAAKPRGS